MCISENLLQMILFFHFRSLVDTVYALKDEVQELRQVGNFYIYNNMEKEKMEGL